MNLQLALSIQVSLNWLWIGLLILAGIVLIAAVLSLFMSIGGVGKRVERIARDMEPQLTLVKVNAQQTGEHLKQVQENAVAIQEDVSMTTEQVKQDVGSVAQTAGVVLENVGWMAADMTKLAVTTATAVGSALRVTKDLKSLLPEPMRIGKRKSEQKNRQKSRRRG